MVGPQYDFVANPQGVVRLTFERAAAALGGDPSASFSGKDWGVTDLFRDFLLEDGGLAKVPILDKRSMNLIRPNSLVRFRGMIQDMLGNELYIGAFKDGETWRTNKFTDVAPFPMPETLEPFFWERRLLHCIPVPGQNSWASESSPSEVLADLFFDFASQQREKRLRDVEIVDNFEDNLSSGSKRQRETSYPHDVDSLSPGQLNDHCHSSDRKNEKPFSCLVKIYDAPEASVKLNDVYEFICIYTFDPELAIHKANTDDSLSVLMDDVLCHLPPSEVPRLHCIMCRKLELFDFLPGAGVNKEFPVLIKGIRESLLGYIAQLLGNDGLAAQCILLHFLSKLRGRVDVVSVGRLSLNLTGFTRESISIYGSQLICAIQNLLPFSLAIPLTVEYLNSANLQPRKDNHTGRLVPGVLQLAEGTHMTIDETCLQSGALDSNGVQNVGLLKHLLEWQVVEYDFEFYKLEMAADARLLILSEGKSNILPADLVLPFRPTAINPLPIASADDLQAWRWYLATLRSIPRTSEPRMHQVLEDEMVAALKEDRSIGCADLSRLLTMAQLVCTSFGETEMSLEHWQMVKEMERRRKERLK